MIESSKSIFRPFRLLVLCLSISSAFSCAWGPKEVSPQPTEHQAKPVSTELTEAELNECEAQKDTFRTKHTNLRRPLLEAWKQAKCEKLRDEAPKLMPNDCFPVADYQRLTLDEDSDEFSASCLNLLYRSIVMDQVKVSDNKEHQAKICRDIISTLLGYHWDKYYPRACSDYWWKKKRSGSSTRSENDVDLDTETLEGFDPVPAEVAPSDDVA